MLLNWSRSAATSACTARSCNAQSIAEGVDGVGTAAATAETGSPGMAVTTAVKRLSSSDMYCTELVVLADVK